VSVVTVVSRAGAGGCAASEDVVSEGGDTGTCRPSRALRHRIEPRTLALLVTYIEPRTLALLLTYQAGVRRQPRVDRREFGLGDDREFSFGDDREFSFGDDPTSSFGNDPASSSGMTVSPASRVTCHIFQY
jgi:hypothetical protein